MRRRLSLLTVLSICATGLLPPSAPGADQKAQPSSAAAILDRYVQVTGGLSLYQRYGFFVADSTVTREDGSTFNTTLYHSRDGTTRIEIDADADSGESGVSNGMAWEYSQKKGVRILDGKVALRRVAEWRGLDADDWRQRYPTAKAAGMQMIDGKNCYHVTLTLTDGSAVEQFYDARSGLLVREIATEFDESGAEEPVTTDVVEYGTWLGFTRPSLMHLKQGNKTSAVRVNSVSFFRMQSQELTIIPSEVARAVAKQHTGGSLPNPVDLLEQFVKATGGKDAYESIRTEVFKAEVTFASQNLKFPVVLYAATGKMYASMDLPSMGKFEFGNDGTTAWQRSVILGPKLEPQSAVGGLLGPSATEILRWTNSAFDLQTLGKEEVNGKPCYNVKLLGDSGGKAGETACFDTETGLLVKVKSVALDGTNLVSTETTIGDYRTDGILKTAHHLETKVAGQEAVINVNEVALNGPLPEGAFDLPADVRALRDKKMAELNKSASPEERPTLRRKQ